MGGAVAQGRTMNFGQGKPIRISVSVGSSN
jgi:hypothetical protein